MKKIDVTKATGSLRDYAENAHDEPVIVMRRGKPLAALVSVDEFDYESVSLSTNPKFIEILARSRARLSKEGGILAAEVRRRFGISPAKGRKK